jgi:hypothetical protein
MARMKSRGRKKPNKLATVMFAVVTILIVIFFVQSAIHISKVGPAKKALSSIMEKSEKSELEP